MSKPNRRRMRREELHQQVSEATGMEPGLDLECDDGTVVTVPHPLFLGDDHQAVLDELRQAGAGTIAMAKAIVGEADHARLLESGYASTDVMLAWLLMQRDMSGVLPDGRPTQSPMSSATIPSA
ncbi:hypothetical protein [Kutzneria chonburiensis]|uniref:Uncharacterized protein n=1 Tax=Kutzneria chonburiensis TaxID=1483604 RepID=A0ABV6N2W4_9PSEU|nr:hypothetical protein [Kutzneria chonburiensis]